MLLNVIVSQNAYVVHVFKSVLVSNVTTVGLQVFVSCTVLQAVFAVKHRYGSSTGVLGRTCVSHTKTLDTSVPHTNILLGAVPPKNIQVIRNLIYKTNVIVVAGVQLAGSEFATFIVYVVLFS